MSNEEISREEAIKRYCEQQAEALRAALGSELFAFLERLAQDGEKDKEHLLRAL